GAAAELAAARARVLYAAIVAPLAGVIHVRLALLEQLAVAGEGIDVLGAGDVRFDLFLHPLLAVGPFDQKPFLLEKSLVIGDELGQSLEWRRRFQDELLHGLAPGVLGEPRGRRGACSPRVVEYDCALASTTVGMCRTQRSVFFPSPREAKRSGERVPSRDSGEAGEGHGWALSIHLPIRVPG